MSIIVSYNYTLGRPMVIFYCKMGRSRSVSLLTSYVMNTILLSLYNNQSDNIPITTEKLYEDKKSIINNYLYTSIHLKIMLIILVSIPTQNYYSIPELPAKFNLVKLQSILQFIRFFRSDASPNSWFKMCLIKFQNILFNSIDELLKL